MFLFQTAHYAGQTLLVPGTALYNERVASTGKNYYKVALAGATTPLVITVTPVGTGDPDCK